MLCYCFASREILNSASLSKLDSKRTKRLPLSLSSHERITAWMESTPPTPTIHRHIRRKQVQVSHLE